MIAPRAVPRVLHGARGRPLTLAEHERVFGPFHVDGDFTLELDSSGLRGRGGAAFATSAKASFLAGVHDRHKRVVVNAMEGEPASHKDRTLLATNPHLVLDGAEALAHRIGASAVTICVARESVSTVNHVSRAVDQRPRRGRRPLEWEVRTPPGRYIAGEESALAHWLDDNETLPQYRATRPSIARTRRGPVFVSNAETHAHVGLIARHGAAWFRSIGTAAHPGSALVSVSGAVVRPIVTEVVLGTPLGEILTAAGVTSVPRALLLGGFGGSWIDGSDLDTPYDNDSLARLGASVGAGVIVVVPVGACGVTELHRITRWMAHESARQCGPCAFGLPAMATNLRELVHPSRDPAHALEELRIRAGAITGRGACRHPDGVVRMIRSGLAVFADDVAQHARGRPCAATGESRFAMVPAVQPESELAWE